MADDEQLVSPIDGARWPAIRAEEIVKRIAEATASETVIPFRPIVTGDYLRIDHELGQIQILAGSMIADLTEFSRRLQDYHALHHHDRRV